MSALTSCPKCSGRVALPTGAHENGWVRCPICGAEYPLRYVQEYRPPELVLIEEPAVPFEGRAPTWGAVAAAAPAPEGAAAGSEIVAPLAGPAVVETLAPPVGAVGLVSSTDINDESDVITFDESLLPDEPTEVLPDTDDTLEPYEISDNLTQGAQSRDVRLADEEETVTVFEPAETSGRVRPSEFGLPPRRRSRRGNPIVMIAGIVGGGVVGLAIGYSILMWVFAKDPFALASKLPAVLVPAALRSAGSQAEPGDAANGPSTQPTASPDDLALDRIAADRSESSPEPSLEPLVDDAKVDSAAVAAADSTTPVDDKAADPFGGPAVTAPPAVSSSNWRVTMPVAGATPGTGEEPVGPTAARQFSLTDLMAAVRAARTTTRWRGA